MNREEAIERFENVKANALVQKASGVSEYWQNEIDGTVEAIDMAIEALENKPTPCEKCIHVKSCRKVIILKNRTYKLIKYCSQGAERREP